jgi:vacuolar-type H+-ATPase subunit H
LSNLSQAGNAVERIGKVVETTRRKVSDARGLAQESVARTQQTATTILGKVQDLGEKATFRMR